MKKVSYLQKKKLTFFCFMSMLMIFYLSAPWEITPAQHDHLHSHPL